MIVYRSLVKNIWFALRNCSYEREQTRDTYVMMKYAHSETDETRTITVSLYDCVRLRPSRHIAKQCSVDSFCA